MMQRPPPWRHAKTWMANPNENERQNRMKPRKSRPGKQTRSSSKRKKGICVACSCWKTGAGSSRCRRAFVAELLQLVAAPGINLQTMTALDLFNLIEAQASCMRGASRQPLTGTPSTEENEARQVKTKQTNEVSIRADERYHRCLLMLKDGC